MVAGVRGVLFFVSVLVVAFAGFSPAATANSKYAAFVMHADSGDVLFERYPDQKRYPASLTKMMTLYLLFEELEAGRLALDAELSISKRAAGQPPSKLGVAAGSTIDVETAIYALVVKSANDVAVVVAENISGSEWQFAQTMTTKARQFGMRNTTFKNASGLPNSKQVTTARDLAILSRRVVQDFPQYLPYFAARDFAWGGRTYRTHNGLIKTFDGADGLKTGYTQRSGFNLATTAKREQTRLIGVVLGGRSVRTRDAHMAEILNAGFAEIAKKPMLVAALYRETPSPRLKPTLLAALAQKENAPALAQSEAMQQKLSIAAASFGPVGSPARARDDLGALISAHSDDFNEYERVRLSSLSADKENLGQGDIEDRLEWSVQIGAYSSKPMAQQELEIAAFAAELLDRPRTVSPVTNSAGESFYRARFTELTEGDALAACERIRAASINCFVLQEPHGP